MTLLAGARRAQFPSRVVVLGVVVLASCSSGGGGRASPRTAEALIAERGTPTVFSIECGRHAYDAASKTWKPVGNFVRLDTWLYANGSTSDVFVLVNGEVIDSSSLPRNIASYPNPGFDPRRVGCGEAEATVTGLVGAPHRSTAGAAAQLTFGQVRLEVNYHLLAGKRNALAVTYANGKLIGMVTL